MSQEESKTTEIIERQLIQDIFKGKYPPGLRLPTIRELASTFAVTTSTVQRVVARLEVMRLIETRQGSGLRVLDRQGWNMFGLMPLIVELSSDDSSKMRELLERLLEVRRVLAAYFFSKYIDRLRQRRGEIEVSVSAFARAIETRAPLEEVMKADLRFIHTLLDATQHDVVLWVFEAFEQALFASPAALEAMYAEPSRNLKIMEGVLERLEGDPLELRRFIEKEVGALDVETAERYGARRGR